MALTMRQPAATPADTYPLATLLRTARLLRDLGIRETARAAGVSPTYIADLEAGRRGARPRAEALPKIASALGLKLATIQAAAVRQRMAALDRERAELAEYLREIGESEAV